LEIIYKSDQETKWRKLGLEVDRISELNRSANAFDLMEDRVSKGWGASACFGGESRECFLEANINDRS
jgi:hypothetical protein